MTIAVIDLETTGLDPDRHQIWEIGLIIHDHVDRQLDGEWHWQLLPNLATADPAALQVSRFYFREKITGSSKSDAVIVKHAGGPPKMKERGTSRLAIARDLARLLNSATVYCAMPHFDAGFLERFMRANKQCPPWHFRLRCVESMAAGHLGHDPGGLRSCANALEIPYAPLDLHTAIGDARLADQIRQRVMKPPVPA